MLTAASTQYVVFEYANMPINCVDVCSPDDVPLQYNKKTSGHMSYQQFRSTLTLDFGTKATIREIKVRRPRGSRSDILCGTSIIVCGTGRRKTKTFQFAKAQDNYHFRLHGVLPSVPPLSDGMHKFNKGELLTVTSSVVESFKNGALSTSYTDSRLQV